MNQQFHICGLGTYVPPRILTNKDLESMMDTSDEWIVSRTGIRERHILDSACNASDAGFFAAEKALKDAGIDASEVTHLLVATCTPDHLTPSVSCHIAGKLGLAAMPSILGSSDACSRVACFDLNAACSGFLYGLEMSRALLTLHPGATILLVAAEALSRRMNYQDRSTSILFGDGAGAVVLRSGDKGLFRLLDVAICADGRMSDLIVIGGGTATHMKPGDTVSEEYFLSMEGREVFKHAVRCMSKESLAMLERNGLTVETLDLFIPHQANMRIIEAVGSRLGVSGNKVYTNVDRYGNTSAASIPIALEDARSEGRLKPGMTTLLTAIGGGLTWGSALLG